MKRESKLIFTGIICTAIIGLLIAAGVVLLSRFSMPKNPNGSGYDATVIALEDAKIHAKLKGSEYQNSLRMPDMDFYRMYSGTLSNYQQIAYTGDGYYTIGSLSKDNERNGICYTDAESGQTVYLCAKPECLHDGSDFCAATNANYDVLQIVWYESALYAVANKTTGDAEHPSAFVLLRYEPDGTGMYELAALDSRGEAYYPELIAHRGALWVAATTWSEIDISDPALGIEGALLTQYYAIWHYEIAKSRLTVLAGGVNNSTQSFSNLQASGDFVYVCKTGGVPKEQENLMENGLYQINAKSGSMVCLAQSPLKNYYIAGAERLLWITKAKEASTETKEIYVLHILSDGVEREVEVPRGEVYFYDGQYLLIGSDDRELSICDLNGNILRSQRFAQEEREYDYAPDRHCFAGADGMLYHIRTEYYGVGSVERITEMQSVPIEGFLSGAEDFTTVFSIYHCWFIP